LGGFGRTAVEGRDASSGLGSPPAPRPSRKAPRTTKELMTLNVMYTKREDWWSWSSGKGHKWISKVVPSLAAGRNIGGVRRGLSNVLELLAQASLLLLKCGVLLSRHGVSSDINLGQGKNETCAERALSSTLLARFLQARFLATRFHHCLCTLVTETPSQHISHNVYYRFSPFDALEFGVQAPWRPIFEGVTRVRAQSVCLPPLTPSISNAVFYTALTSILACSTSQALQVFHLANSRRLVPQKPHTSLEIYPF
jgi:hypothetical protein